MNTRCFALALVTLATLVTACDTEPTTTTELDASTFRGEVFVPPTTTGGTVLIGKGGHDLPTEILQNGYDRAPIEIQDIFLVDIEKQVIESLEADFLANEATYEECPWLCDGMGMSWDEGVYVGDLHFEIGAVWLAESRTGLHWQTEASGEAQVGCGCI